MKFLHFFLIFSYLVTKAYTLHDWLLVTGFDPVTIQFDVLVKPIVQATIARGTKCTADGCTIITNLPKIVLINVTTNSFTLRLVDTHNVSSADGYQVNCTFLIAWIVLESGYFHESTHSDILYAGSIDLDFAKPTFSVTLDNSKLKLTPGNSAFSAILVAKDDEDISDLVNIYFSSQIYTQPHDLDTVSISFTSNATTKLSKTSKTAKLHYFLVNTYKLQKTSIGRDKNTSDFYVRKIFLKDGMTMPLEWAYPEPLLLPCQSITDPTDNPVSTITAKMDFQWIARTNESKIFEFYIIQKSPALSGDELLSKNIYFLILNMTKPPPLLKLDILPLNMGFYDTKNVYKSFSAPQVVYTWLSGIGNKYCLLAHAIEPNSDVDCHALCNFYASNPKYCHRYGTGMEIDTVETYNRFATNNMSDCIEKFLIPLCKFPNVRDLSDDNMMESEYPLEDQQPTLLKNVEPSAFACRGSAPGGDYVVCRMSQLKDKWFYSSYQVCKYYLEHKGEHWTSSVVSIAASDDDTSAGGGAKYYVTYEICKVVVNASNFLKCHELGNKNCPKLPDLQFYPIENQKMHSNYILYSFCCPNRSSTKSNIKPSNDTIPDGVILSDERHAQGLASMPDIYHSPKDKDNTGAKLHDSIMNDVKQSQIQNNTILSAKHQTSISIDISNTLSGGILYVPIYGSEVAPTYIKETCIYSEWEEWSACELPCQLKNKVVNRRRRRTLLQGIGTKCHTIETEPCQDIPDCSSMCLMSEWSEWSKCKVDKENGLSYSVRHILYDSDKCKDQTLELWRSCKDADLDEYTTKDSYDLNLAINELEFAGNMDKEYDITNDYKMAVSSTWSGCTQPCDNRNNRGVNISLKDSERSTNTINTRSCTEKFPPCAFDEVINCEEIRPVLPGLTKQSCISGCRTILSNCKTDHLKCYAFAEFGSKQDKNFFNNCRLNDELEKKIAQVKNLQYNKCYISRASYLVDENSWIDARYNACNCYEEGAVPCDEQDVFLSLEDLPEDMMASSVCPVEALAPSGK